MDIFTLARLASYRLPWFTNLVMALLVVLLAGYVTRYLWLNVIYVILAGLTSLYNDWQRAQDETTKLRRLNELAIVQTRRQLIAGQRMELVSKWEGADIEIEEIQ